MKFLLFALRFLLGALFLYSGLSKVRMPYEFLATVGAYHLTGPILSVVVAAVLPWIEIVLGVCLISGVLAQGAMIGAALLVGLFTMAITLAWWRGLHISCGCFGSGGALVGPSLVARSACLLLLSLVGCGLELAAAQRGGPLRAGHVPDRCARRSSPQLIAVA